MDATPVEITPRTPARSRGLPKALEADDPYELVGVRYPMPPGVDADREVARAFVEEYALLGWSRAHVRMLFETPQFAGAHQIRRRRGDPFVDEVLTEVFGPPAVRGPAAPDDREDA